MPCATRTEVSLSELTCEIEMLRIKSRMSVTILKFLSQMCFLKSLLYNRLENRYIHGYKILDKTTNPLRSLDKQRKYTLVLGNLQLLFTSTVTKVKNLGAEDAETYCKRVKTAFKGKIISMVVFTLLDEHKGC